MLDDLVSYLTTKNYSKMQFKHDACNGHLKQRLNDALSVVLDGSNVMGNGRMHLYAQML